MRKKTNGRMFRKGGPPVRWFIMLDQAKAFDSVAWATINTVIPALGFGHLISSWIATIYNPQHPMMRRIRCNGMYSHPLEVRCGTAQGDVCSPILFTCVMEALTRMIDHGITIDGTHRTLPGITIGGHTFHYSLYADDTTCYLADPHTELPILWALLRRFERATGLLINDSKTEGVPLGPLRDDPDSLPDSHLIKWAKDGDIVISLGAPIGNNIDIDSFWMTKYRTFKARIGRWARTAFLIPTESRVPILATLSLSLFWYNLQSLPMPRILSRTSSSRTWNISYGKSAPH